MDSLALGQSVSSVVSFLILCEMFIYLYIFNCLHFAGLLENFYSRQAKVYMMAKNQLFHAAALHKLFVLRKEQKKTLTKEEARM